MQTTPFVHTIRVSTEFTKRYGRRIFVTVDGDRFEHYAQSIDGAVLDAMCYLGDVHPNDDAVITLNGEPYTPPCD